MKHNDNSLLENILETIVILMVTGIYCVPFFCMGVGLGTGIFG